MFARNAPPRRGGARSACTGRRPRSGAAGDGGTQGRLVKAIFEPVILALPSFSRTKTLARFIRAHTSVCARLTIRYTPDTYYMPDRYYLPYIYAQYLLYARHYLYARYLLYT